jgi:hypothetical protein
MAGLGNLALGTPLVIGVLVSIWLLQRGLDLADRRQARRLLPARITVATRTRPADPVALHTRRRDDDSLAA